jgi:alkylation response protein AidB-like acyl-CoA dehydrogenase
VATNTHPQPVGFRATVRAFLAEHLPPGWTGLGSLDRSSAARFVDEWRALLHEHGLLAVAWPKEHGGAGLTKLDQVIVAEECARVGVPAGAHADIFGIKMLGNTLLRLGTEEQKRRFLPRILSGEDRWCQGFSEPDAGSDLASLTTSSTLDGDQWRISGHRFGTSRASDADWMFLLARTDRHAPRHRGLSFLLCPLDQPGVDIRPIRMLTGETEFHEVFFQDARTDASNIVGAPGDGWAAAMTLLGHERGEDAAVHPILFRHEFDRLVGMAKERGRADDPVIRDRIARCYGRVEIMRLLGRRILEAVMQDDSALGPEVSVAKLYWSEYHQEVTELALEILGAGAMVVEGRPPTRPVRADDPAAPNSSASWLGTFYNSRAGTIYAGSSEIQRNILAESVLGLPKLGQPGRHLTR